MRTTVSPRSLSVLLVLAAAALLTACSPPRGVSIDWSIGPVKFSLTPDGKIEVSGQKQWVTAVGTFSVGNDPEVNDEEQKFVLVIRHMQDAIAVDDIYTIPTTAEVHLDLDGRTKVDIRGHTFTVNAIEAEIREITLKGVAWQMPDLRGRTLQDAQDELARRTDGVLTYRSAYDASGRGRHPSWHSDWQVCTQSVPPGAAVTADSTVGFGVVRQDETCPDGKPIPAAVWTMPSMVGKHLDTANEELGGLTAGAISTANTHDATGGDRTPYFTESWVICSQNPPAMSTITAASPIEYGVVGDDEDCPAVGY